MSEILINKIRENLQKADDRLKPIVEELEKISERFSKEFSEATEGKVVCKLSLNFMNGMLGGLGGYMSPMMLPQPMPIGMSGAPGYVDEHGVGRGAPPKPSNIPISAAISAFAGKKIVVTLWQSYDVLSLFDAHTSAAADIVRDIARNAISEETSGALLFALNDGFGHGREDGQSDAMEEMIALFKDKLESATNDLRAVIATWKKGP